MDGEWQIAKIVNTFLGFEDHGVFTFTIFLDFGGAGQGAGLRMYGNSEGPYEGSKLYEHLTGVLAAAGVDSWEQLKGRTIMACGDYSGIWGLKPLPTEQGREFFFNEKDRP